MSQLPSVRGSILTLDVEALRKHLASGRVSLRELERRLGEEDLAALDATVDVSGWYDIRIEERLVLLRCELEAEGDEAGALLRMGADAAERLLELSAYKQLDYLQFIHQKPEGRGISPEAARLTRRSDLKLLASLGSSIYNFGRWTVERDPEHEDRLQIEWSGASAMPDVLARTSEGFLNRLAAVHDDAGLWWMSRPSRDTVLYRMTRSS